MMPALTICALHRTVGYAQDDWRSHFDKSVTEKVSVRQLNSMRRRMQDSEWEGSPTQEYFYRKPKRALLLGPSSFPNRSILDK